jgi:very-short-patch-repair endonuclease
MRRDPSPFERRLWLALRAKRFEGAKFRRQKVIGPYIVDLSCRMPRMLVIEVDGDSHGAQAAYDERRSTYLMKQGYQVLRFTNQEVASNFEGVLFAIQTALESPLSPTLSPEGEREIGAL